MSRQHRRRPASGTRHKFPSPEVLEGRLAPAVSVVRSLGMLSIAMDAAGDVANLSNGTPPHSVTVNGVEYDSIRAIEIDGKGFEGQTVNLDGAIHVFDRLIVNDVSAVHLNGTFRTKRINIQLGGKPGGIGGSGGFTAVYATFDAGKNDITLDGPNDFQGDVRIERAGDVSLTDAVSTLELTRMTISGGATVTSPHLRTPGSHPDIERFRGESLTLQPISPEEKIGINGPGAGYHLSQREISELGGFKALTIGREDGEHEIVLGRVRLPGHATIRAPKGGSITVLDPLTHSGEGRVTLSAPTTLAANVSIEQGGFSIEGPVTLDHAHTVRIEAGGPIRIPGPIDDPKAATFLELKSLVGDVSLGAVGGSVPLKGLRILSAKDVMLGGPIRAGFVEQDFGIGTTTISAPITVTGAGDGLLIDIRTGKIVQNADLVAAGKTVRLKADEGMTSTASIQAHHLVLRGTGPFQLGSANRGLRIDNLSAQLNGALDLLNAKDLSIVRYGDINGVDTVGKAIHLGVNGRLTIGPGMPGKPVFLLADPGPITVFAGSLTQGANSQIYAGSLGLKLASGADLGREINRVNTLAADVLGDLSFVSREPLTIGTVGGISGIRTHNGNVRVQSYRSLDVDATVDTTPGAGGKRYDVGNSANLKVKKEPVLGRGSVTFVVPDQPVNRNGGI